MMKWESRFHNVLDKVLFFVKGYKYYSTTIGSKMWFSYSGWGNPITGAHEGMHVLQAKKQTTLLHSLLYTSPQCFALLALLAIPFSLYWLLCLLFLLPIPSYFRMKKELQAYRVSVMIEKWLTGTLRDGRIDSITSQFTGPNYFFMWPFRKFIRNRLQQSVFVASLVPGLGHHDPYIQMLFDTIKENGMLHEHATDPFWKEAS